MQSVRIATAVVAGCAALAGCSSRHHQAAAPPSSSPFTTASSGPSTSATTAVDRVTALNELADRYGTVHATSAVAHSPSGDFAAVSYNVASPGAGTHPHVAIYAFAGGAWTTATDITLDIGGEVLPPPSNATPITLVHLTGGEAPDFAVVVDYNDGPAAAIISRTSGSWHALAFSGGRHGGDEIHNPSFTDTAVVERVNTCTPECASGNYVTTTYRYSPGTGRMEAVG